MIGPGMPFPNFSLQNQDGETVTLKSFTGKWLVVYVYPKDDTPGCTIQGKSFTATRLDFQAASRRCESGRCRVAQEFLQQVCFHHRPAGRYQSRAAESRRCRAERIQRHDVLESNVVRDRSRREARQRIDPTCASAPGPRPRAGPRSGWSATIRARSRCRCGAAKMPASFCRTRTSSANSFDWAIGAGRPNGSASPRTILA